MRLFSDVASRVADPHLSRAVTLALKASGKAAPNPLVGCVIVKDGSVVGEGYHPRAGEPHAEVFALADAGERARGGTAYVTLEPCRHHGRTPPCTDALIASGVSRVVVGMADPTSDAGGGVAQLRAAGIEAVFADDPGPFEEINAGWLQRILFGRPRIRVKLGLTLDGRIALRADERSDITGPSGGVLSAQLRGVADAVLVGKHTVDVDDPALTVRDPGGRPVEHQPLRVVLCRSALPSDDARLIASDEAPTLLLVPKGAAEHRCFPGHVIVDEYQGAEGISGALQVLGDRGLNEVLVEPGSQLFSALWVARLIDELVTISAGSVAGRDGLGFFDDCELEHEDRSLERRFVPVEAGIVGDVSAVVWRPLSRG